MKLGIFKLTSLSLNSIVLSDYFHTRNVCWGSNAFCVVLFASWIKKYIFWKSANKQLSTQLPNQNKLMIHIRLLVNETVTEAYFYPHKKQSTGIEQSGTLYLSIERAFLC